ncbi:uncharacterized protein B0H18DRAFT_1208561 [Fomitopsis serialis]|uniref:uncharacterized protein n=1 Tax=Fomitopsis serialis TaxID=139415 RepID=UPI0020076658|nr:uncharacterized protein B0H18DRAFT_1208561 [Neoantrodia serialis]KAH9932247.1 hypothetical protein B0H18DRAFT_1208561 [Neoantrodia serialis]
MPGPDLPSESVLKIPDLDRARLMRGESTVCTELCRVAQTIFDNCPHGEKLVAWKTRDHPDSSDRNDYSAQSRVDVSFYPADDDAKADYERRMGQDVFGASIRWAWISLLVEIEKAS